MIDFDGIDLTERTFCQFKHHVAISLCKEMIGTTVVGVSMIVFTCRFCPIDIPDRATHPIWIGNILIHGITGIFNIKKQGSLTAELLILDTRAFRTTHVDDHTVVLLQFRNAELTALTDSHITVRVFTCILTYESAVNGSNILVKETTFVWCSIEPQSLCLPDHVGIVTLHVIDIHEHRVVVSRKVVIISINNLTGIL